MELTAVVRASDLWSRDREFDSRSVHCWVAQVKSAFHPSGVGKSGTSLLAGVKAGCIYLCRVAGNTAWSHVAGDCSEISCNVKWNVYLAMEIPDCVSFISGQNSDDRVRSCEPNVFLA